MYQNVSDRSFGNQKLIRHVFFFAVCVLVFAIEEGKGKGRGWKEREGRLREEEG